jgi:hypothetical protein
MSLLKDHLRSGGSTEDGVRAYIVDVTARYPQLDRNTWGHRRQVTCHWTVGYVTKTDVAASLLMMPFWLIGHAMVQESRIEFVTFHYLTYSEARRLRWMRILRQSLVPFVILAMVAVGIALVFGLVGVVATVFHLDPSPNPLPVWPVVLSVLGLAVIFWATLKGQQWLWKMGQPLHTDAFGDRRIQLRSVEIQSVA